MNFSDPIRQHAAESPERAAIVAAGETLSYAELDARTDRLAASLKRLGLNPGDPVMVMLPTGIPSLVSTIAVFKAGLLHVAVNILFKDAEVTFMARDCGARALIAGEGQVPIAEQARQQSDSLEHLIVAGEASSDSLSYFDLLDVEPKGPQTVDLPPSASGALIYTGGTTGTPKGALHDHENLVTQTVKSNGYFGIQPGDRTLGVLPSFLLPPFYSGHWSALSSGATLFIQERFDAEMALDLILSERIDSMVGTKTMIFLFNELPTRSGEDLGFMKLTAFGGMSQPAEVRRAFEQRFNRRVLHIYGMSETVNLISGVPRDLDEETRLAKFESVGKPLPGIEAAILRDDGTRAEADESGEICLRDDGSGTWKPMLRYHNRPEETQEALRGGWLHTDDLGHLDADGFLYVQGRRQELIKVSGWSVFPAEIENVISLDERVEQVAVAPVSDPRSGETPVAFVKLRPGQQVAKEELIELVDRRLAKFKRIRDVEFVDEFPVNLYGKVQKHRLTDMYEQAGSTARPG